LNTKVFEANGTAERHVALVMPEQIPGTKKVTVAGDKAYETANFVAECRNLKITPQVAQNLGRSGARMADTTVVDTNASTPGLCCNRAQLGSLLAILFEFCVQALNRALGGWRLQSPLGHGSFEPPKLTCTVEIPVRVRDKSTGRRIPIQTSSNGTKLVQRGLLDPSPGGA
jgi:hypothetical protein